VEGATERVCVCVCVCGAQASHIRLHAESFVAALAALAAPHAQPTRGLASLALEGMLLPRTLPDAAARLPCLVHVSLRGCAVDRFVLPELASKLPRLADVELDGCGGVGATPVWIGSMCMRMAGGTAVKVVLDAHDDDVEALADGMQMIEDMLNTQLVHGCSAGTVTLDWQFK